MAAPHAQTIIDVILQLADAGQPFRVAGFLDDDPALHGARYQGIAVLGPIAKVAIFDAKARRRKANAENRPASRFCFSLRTAAAPRLCVEVDPLRNLRHLRINPEWFDPQSTQMPQKKARQALRWHSRCIILWLAWMLSSQRAPT